MKKSRITIYKLPWGNSFLEDRENWFQDREEGLSYDSQLSGEEAAEEAFHLTNAPEDYLEEDQKRLLQRLEFKGPSLSVGDVVRVDSYIKKHSTPASYYICKSFGWEKFSGDIIRLLKHLP